MKARRPVDHPQTALEKIDIVESRRIRSRSYPTRSAGEVQRVSVVDDRDRVMEVVGEESSVVASGKKGRTCAGGETNGGGSTSRARRKAPEVEAQVQGLERDRRTNEERSRPQMSS